MTHKERILKTIRGEMADRLPYVPRLDLWHNANALANTLPERHRGKGPDEICRAEGWALHKAVPDFANEPDPDAMLHRALGIFALQEQVFRVVFSPKVEIRVQREGGRTAIEYLTPRGAVRTVSVYSEEMKKAGISIPWIAEHAIKKREDYDAVACLFENVDLVPHYEEFERLQREVGEDGVLTAYFTGCPSPIHHIQKQFLDATEFYFHYKDYEKEMRRLAESMEPLYDKALQLTAASPAEIAHWGGNYDDMVTYPPYFEKDLLPWIRKASERLGACGKYVSCHCDGENEGLMDLIRDSGMHVAEAVCPAPMTKVTIEEYYRRWADKLTIFGGIPSTLLLAGIDDRRGVRGVPGPSVQGGGPGEEDDPGDRRHHPSAGGFREAGADRGAGGEGGAAASGRRGVSSGNAVGGARGGEAGFGGAGGWG